MKKKRKQVDEEILNKRRRKAAELEGFLHSRGHLSSVEIYKPWVDPWNGKIYARLDKNTKKVRGILRRLGWKVVKRRRHPLMQIEIYAKWDGSYNLEDAGFKAPVSKKKRSRNDKTARRRGGRVRSNK